MFWYSYLIAAEDLCSNMALVLLAKAVQQIPLSGAGTTYAWSSPLVIAMLTVGGALAVVFVWYEWRLASIPIMPGTANLPKSFSLG